MFRAEYVASGTLYRQCLRRCYYDTVSGMHTYRVDVFHVTYGDAVALLSRITSYSISFHPAIQRSTRTCPTRERRRPFSRISTSSSLIVGDTATASAKCVSRTKNNRISDAFGKFNTIFYIFNDLRCCTRLTDLFHWSLNSRRSFCLLDGL